MRRCSKWWRTRGSESCAARKASPSIPLAFFLLIGFAVLERASFALSLSLCRGIDALLVRLEAPTRHSPERRSRCVATLRESPSSAWNRDRFPGDRRLRAIQPVSLDVGQHVSAHAFRQSRDVLRGLAAASGGLVVPQLEHV